MQVVDVNARKVGEVGAQKKLQEKKKSEQVVGVTKTPSGIGKVEQKQASKKKKSSTLTSFLTAHSKV